MTTVVFDCYTRTQGRRGTESIFKTLYHAFHSVRPEVNKPKSGITVCKTIQFPILPKLELRYLQIAGALQKRMNIQIPLL